MELQIGVKCLHARVWGYQNSRSHELAWNFRLIRLSTRVKWHQDPHAHVTSNWHGVRNPHPCNFKLTKSTRIRWRQNYHPHGTSIWLGMLTRVRWYQNSHPPGTSNWLAMFTRVRWYQKSQPHGTSNWFGMCTRVRWYQGSHAHGSSKWLRMFKGVRWHQDSYHDGTSNWLGMFARVRWYQNSTRMEFQIELGYPQKKMVSSFPLLWKSKLTWHVHKGKKISNLLMELQTDLACSQG
jgi:hypothetical protein